MQVPPRPRLEATSGRRQRPSGDAPTTMTTVTTPTRPARHATAGCLRKTQRRRLEAAGDPLRIERTASELIGDGQTVASRARSLAWMTSDPGPPPESRFRPPRCGTAIYLGSARGPETSKPIIEWKDWEVTESAPTGSRRQPGVQPVVRIAACARDRRCRTKGRKQIAYFTRGLDAGCTGQACSFRDSSPVGPGTTRGIDVARHLTGYRRSWRSSATLRG